MGSCQNNCHLLISSPSPLLYQLETSNNKTKQILCPIGADLWSSSQHDTKTSTRAKSKLAGMNSWEQRGRAWQNHYVHSSSGSKQAEVMCSHEDTCYSRLKSDPKRGTDWYKLHRSAPSQHLCRYRFLQVVQQWVSETWVVQTKDTLYNNCIEKTFTFPKPSTQALLLCDVHRLTEENKKTSLWTSQVNKGRNRVRESRTASSWQVKELILK